MDLAREEIRIKAKTRNNRLHKLIIDGGWVLQGKPNVASFSRDLGINNSTVGKLLNLRENPFCLEGRNTGEYVPVAKKIAKHFNVDVKILFPRHLYAIVLNSKTSKAITLAQLPYVQEMITSQLSSMKNDCMSGVLIPNIKKMRGE